MKEPAQDAFACWRSTVPLFTNYGGTDFGFLLRK
jgi:hypothetical protein